MWHGVTRSRGGYSGRPRTSRARWWWWWCGSWVDTWKLLLIKEAMINSNYFFHFSISDSARWVDSSSGGMEVPWLSPPGVIGVRIRRGGCKSIVFSLK